jgi:GTP-binding protein HflX
MFATLDPTARVLKLPTRRQAVLSDTVGFIRRLPTTLVQAFRATLEEVSEASLLLHVVDLASAEAEEHGAHVMEVLGDIGAAEIPQIVVLNKIDRADAALDEDAFLHRMMGDLPETDAERMAPVRVVKVSAKTGEGLPGLVEAIDRALPVDPVERAVFRLPAGAGAELHLLHEYGRVISTTYDGDECIVEAEASESLRRRLAEHIE